MRHARERGSSVFAFTYAYGSRSPPSARARARLLGPCFKTGRMEPRLGLTARADAILTSGLRFRYASLRPVQRRPRPRALRHENRVTKRCLDGSGMGFPACSREGRGASAGTNASETRARLRTHGRERLPRRTGRSADGPTQAKVHASANGTPRLSARAPHRPRSPDVAELHLRVSIGNAFASSPLTSRGRTDRVPRC